ncbi:hypothetical protein LXL04_032678 [Taraxacum kok-saghyz]
MMFLVLALGREEKEAKKRIQKLTLEFLMMLAASYENEGHTSYHYYQRPVSAQHIYRRRLTPPPVFIFSLRTHFPFPASLTISDPTITHFGFSSKQRQRDMEKESDFFTADGCVSSTAVGDVNRNGANHLQRASGRRLFVPLILLNLYFSFQSSFTGSKETPSISSSLADLLHSSQRKNLICC